MEQDIFQYIPYCGIVRLFVSYRYVVNVDIQKTNNAVD
jgi:hypothetical protein